jgi:hypothetical protein
MMMTEEGEEEEEEKVKDKMADSNCLTLLWVFYTPSQLLQKFEEFSVRINFPFIINDAAPVNIRKAGGIDQPTDVILYL